MPDDPLWSSDPHAAGAGDAHSLQLPALASALSQSACSTMSRFLPPLPLAKFPRPCPACYSPLGGISGLSRAMRPHPKAPCTT